MVNYKVCPIFLSLHYGKWKAPNNVNTIFLKIKRMMAGSQGKKVMITITSLVKFRRQKKKDTIRDTIR